MTTLVHARRKDAVHVGIGAFAVGGPGDVLEANLGSCLGIVLFNPASDLFVMAHTLLPRPCSAGDVRHSRYARTAVPHLLLEMGIQSDSGSTFACIAGGAAMYDENGGVGAANVSAGLGALSASGVTLYESDVGGRMGRRVVVDCAARTIQVIRVDENAPSLLWDLSTTVSALEAAAFTQRSTAFKPAARSALYGGLRI